MPECSLNVLSPNLFFHVKAPLDTPIDRLVLALKREQQLYASHYRSPVPSHTRPYEQPTLETLKFSIERRGRGWSDILKDWNATDPEVSFEDPREGVAVFAKGVRRAYRQLTGRKLEWKQPPM